MNTSNDRQFITRSVWVLTLSVAVIYAHSKSPERLMTVEEYASTWREASELKKKFLLGRHREYKKAVRGCTISRQPCYRTFSR